MKEEQVEKITAVLNFVSVAGVLVATLAGGFIAGRLLPAGVYPRAALVVPGLAAGFLFWGIARAVSNMVLRAVDR